MFASVRECLLDDAVVRIPDEVVAFTGKIPQELIGAVAKLVRKVPIRETDIEPIFQPAVRIGEVALLTSIIAAEEIGSAEGKSGWGRVLFRFRYCNGGRNRR